LVGLLIASVHNALLPIVEVPVVINSSNEGIIEKKAEGIIYKGELYINTEFCE